MRSLLSIHYVAWLILSACCTACGDYLSKRFAQHPSFSWAALATLAYIVGSLFWFPAIYQRNLLSTTGAMWAIGSTLAAFCLGVFGFDETINGWNLIGIGCAILAFVFLAA